MEGDLSAAGWWLSGGAALTFGSESFGVAGAGSMSLDLPDGSTALSPSICVTIKDPELRFFVLNNGDKKAVLKVTSLFIGSDGKPHTKDLGDVKGSSAWTLTSPIKFKDSIQPGPDGTGQIAFMFTPKDSKGDWQIDDFYVDPLKSQ